MTELVSAAFRALGAGPTVRELALVAKAIRESRDDEALALFGLPSKDEEPVFDRRRCRAVQQIALDAGAGPFVGLDLYTQMLAPGWSPFPVVAADD